MRIIKPLLIITVVTILGVLTYYVESKRSEEYSSLSGMFENQPTEVAARTAGRVLRLVAREGTAVKRGDLLVELDPGPVMTESKALGGRAAEAKARLRELEAGFRREDIERQAAVVDELKAALDKSVNGARYQEIEQARARLAAAQAQYDKARTGARPEELERAQANLASKQATLDFAQAEYERYSALYESGAVSRQLYERTAETLHAAESAVTVAKQSLLELERGNRREDIAAAAASVQEASEQLSLLEAGSRSEDIAAARARLAAAAAELQKMRAGNRPEDIAIAKAAWNTAQLNYEASQQRVSEYKVTAPIDGVVERELVSIGDLTNAGQALVRLANPEDIWLRVYLAEDKLALVAVGDNASLKIDGISDPVNAYVDSIATTGEFTPVNLQTPQERGGQFFAIRLRLKQPDGRVKAGMAATVKTVGKWSCR